MDGPRRLSLALALTLGCGADPDALDPDASPDAPADVAPIDVTPDRASPDGPTPLDVTRPMDVAPPPDASPDVAPDAAPDVAPDRPSAPTGIAPPGAVGGEVTARDGSNAVPLMPNAERVFRVDASPTEHVQFFLRFSPNGAAVILQVDRWEAIRPVELGRTDAGPGLRVLAAFDPTGPRTFWARVRSTAATSNVTLTVTRTPFADGARCASDCDRLLQFPLANDPAVDGYTSAASTVFRYQFGRRDLLMHVRHAGQLMARTARAPFIPEDFSQWDGMTPGTDTGNLRHSSHQRGKDVDISLYGTDGRAPWRSYCTARPADGGRECTPGTARGFDAATNVRLFADHFATGRVTMCFLDRELIALVQPAARAAMLPAAVAAQFSDGTHLQHWPNHDNHIHVRVSEGPTTGAGLVYEPFEPP